MYLFIYGYLCMNAVTLTYIYIYIYMYKCVHGSAYLCITRSTFCYITCRIKPVWQLQTL